MDNEPPEQPAGPPLNPSYHYGRQGLIPDPTRPVFLLPQVASEIGRNEANAGDVEEDAEGADADLGMAIADHRARHEANMAVAEVAFTWRERLPGMPDVPFIKSPAASMIPSSIFDPGR
jgi:hypothetical protein